MSAAVYGVADFAGGYASRRANARSVVLVSQATGIPMAALLVVVFPEALFGGVGFGVFFVFLAQVPDGSGAVPLVAARGASVIGIEQDDPRLIALSDISMNRPQLFEPSDFRALVVGTEVEV